MARCTLSPPQDSHTHSPAHVPLVTAEPQVVGSPDALRSLSEPARYTPIQFYTSPTPVSLLIFSLALGPPLNQLLPGVFLFSPSLFIAFPEPFFRESN